MQWVVLWSFEILRSKGVVRKSKLSIFFVTTPRPSCTKVVKGGVWILPAVLPLTIQAARWTITKSEWNASLWSIAAHWSISGGPVLLIRNPCMGRPENRSRLHTSLKVATKFRSPELSSCWDGDEARRRCPSWNWHPMLCSRQRPPIYAQPATTANAPRSQAEFPHLNRKVSLTNASVIRSLLFVVVLDFRTWNTTAGTPSVILDVDNQLRRSNSTLAMLNVVVGELHRVNAAQGLSSFRRQEQVGLCPCWWPCCLHWYLNVPWAYVRPTSESSISYENMTSQVMTISSVDDEEKMSSLKNGREQSSPHETAPRPITHVHLWSVACHRGWFSTAPFCF